MSEVKTTITIVPSELKKQVEEGMKKDALAAHYGLSISQMGKALKALNLTIRKFHAPAFVFAEEGVAETAAPSSSEEVADMPEPESEGEIQEVVLESTEKVDSAAMAQGDPAMAEAPAVEEGKVTWGV